MVYNVELSKVMKLQGNLEFHDYLKSEGIFNHSPPENVNFAGGTTEQAMDWLINGNTDTVDQINSLIQEMEAQDILTPGVLIPAPYYYGSAPRISAVISGHPKAMYKRVRVEAPNLQAPLSIYIDSLVSAKISHEILANRGAAALAFALAMKKVRPVELHLCALCDPFYNAIRRGVAVQIDLQSTDLSVASYMLTHPSFLRRLVFYVARKMAGINTANPEPVLMGIPTVDTTELRQILGMSAHDVYIPGAFNTDSSVWNNPIKWVKNKIAKHTGATAEQSRLQLTLY